MQANAPANRDSSGSHGQGRIIALDGNIFNEATIFGEDGVEATLDLSRASDSLALRSADRGPLWDWWKAGFRHVRAIEQPHRWFSQRDIP